METARARKNARRHHWANSDRDKLLARLAEGALEGDVALMVAKGLGLALSAVQLMLPELHRQKVVDRLVDGKAWTRLWSTPSGKMHLASLSRPAYELAEEFDDWLDQPDEEIVEPPPRQPASASQPAVARANGTTAGTQRAVRVVLAPPAKAVEPVDSTKLEQQARELASAQAEVAALKGELSRAEERAEVAAAERAEAAGKVADLERRLVDAGREAASNKADLEKLRQRYPRELDDARSRQAGLEARIADLTRAAEGLEAENAAMRLRLQEALSPEEAERLRAELVSTTRQLGRLAKKGAAAIVLVEELRSAESAALRYREVTERQLEELEQLVLRLRADIAAVERRAGAAEARIVGVSGKLSTARIELRKARAEAGRLRGAKDDLMALRRHVRSLESQVAGSEKVVAAIQSRLATAEANAEALKATLGESVLAKRSLETELAREGLRFKRVDGRRRTLETKVRTILAELKEAKREAVRAAKASDELRRQLDEVEAHLGILSQPGGGAETVVSARGGPTPPRLRSEAVRLLEELDEDGPTRDRGGEAAERLGETLNLDGGEVRKILAGLCRRGLVELDREGSWVYGIWITVQGREIARADGPVEDSRDDVVVKLPVRRAV